MIKLVTRQLYCRYDQRCIRAVIRVDHSTSRKTGLDFFPSLEMTIGLFSPVHEVSILNHYAKIDFLKLKNTDRSQHEKDKKTEPRKILTEYFVSDFYNIHQAAAIELVTLHWKLKGWRTLSEKTNHKITKQWQSYSFKKIKCRCLYKKHQN